jgi:pyruvate dehydrogenase E1 component alpha subunit
LEPLLRIRRYLSGLGVWGEAEEQELQQQCAAEVESAVSAYLATPAQSTDAMFDHLFAVLPAHLRAQRAAARKYATKSSGHH